ncbi:TetR/AcrR family transcriptional regulator [Candidatus Sulfidibacterium hydrothermale]|uniref:TetR/AcrR family transcriptional regulator n=1 Tax=Candidatus Sulfidibacterium hydrothermale TaxID=2875962 RepID=UPI001F0ADC87|nr:TetR/AcrR family transcriptional regulator [Candidatus Sulfidibacterium hydrothermale]UBM61645.1 TetR/AcrR family transcriptional regulator [Candidatus Sulfidibacterium hydrothermale]
MLTKKEKVRKDLIKAAATAFMAKGYTGTTMDDIAQATGKAKSTLYYYFESKKEAFQEVVQLEGEILRKKLLKIVQDPRRTARQKLEDYILTRWKEFEKLGRRYQTMRQEFIHNARFVDKYRQQYDELERQFIAEIIRQGVKSKEFRIQDSEVELMALTLSLTMKTLEIPFFAEGDVRTFLPKLKRLLDVLFHGLVA